MLWLYLTFIIPPQKINQKGSQWNYHAFLHNPGQSSTMRSAIAPACWSPCQLQRLQGGARCPISPGLAFGISPPEARTRLRSWDWANGMGARKMLTSWTRIFEVSTQYDDMRIGIQYMTIYDNIWQYMTIYDSIWYAIWYNMSSKYFEMVYTYW